MNKLRFLILTAVLLPRLAALLAAEPSKPQRARLEDLMATIAAGQKPVLHVVIKSDVQGSVEAISTSLGQIESTKINLNIVHAAVGPINENDILLATASNAVARPARRSLLRLRARRRRSRNRSLGSTRR